VNGTKAAPFGQHESFYTVGGTNKWFPDGPEKPWLVDDCPAQLSAGTELVVTNVATGYLQARDGRKAKQSWFALFTISSSLTFRWQLDIENCLLYSLLFFWCSSDT